MALHNVSVSNYHPFAEVPEILDIIYLTPLSLEILIVSSGRNQQYLVPPNSNFRLQFLYVETALVAANYILQIVFLCIYT